MFKSRLEKKAREAEEKSKTSFNRTEDKKENLKALSVSTPSDDNTSVVVECSDVRENPQNNSVTDNHFQGDVDTETASENVCDKKKPSSTMYDQLNYKEQTEKEGIVLGTSSEVLENDDVIDIAGFS